MNQLNIKQLAEQLNRDQLYELVARMSILAEINSAKDMVENADDNEESDVKNAKELLTNPDLLGEQAGGYCDHIDLSTQVQHYTRWIAPEYVTTK